ncbi:MAG TPA: hypothetical protein VFV50_12950 [Bdellovibrionales bacterium]|nr:hypothetical protein [Bdellovibrionales bacterium]
MTKWTFAALLLALPAAAQAADPINYSIHQHYVSPRALGMGNAFVGVADDYNALFYNPAGLATLKEGEINLKIQVAGSGNIIDFSNQLKDASNAADKETAYNDVLNKNYGSNYFLRFPNIGGTWARPGWAVAVIPADLSAEIGVHQQLGPTLTVEGYQDTTIAFGKAWTFFADQPAVLHVGTTGKAIYRGYVLKSVSAPELVNNDKFFTPEDAQEGMTIDADVGALYSWKAHDQGGAAWTQWARPQVGLTVRNIADWGFKQNYHIYNKETGEPPKMERRFDVGGMADLPGFWVFKPRFALDVRDIGHRYWTFKKGFRTGVELLWNVRWWLQGGYRVGLSQGYLSAGLSAQFVWFRLDFATWGEEIGTAGAPKENRRYVAQMSLSF